MSGMTPGDYRDALLFKVTGESWPALAGLIGNIRQEKDRIW
jgi:hypothetical protein